MLPPYHHEPFTDFSIQENRHSFEKALLQLERQLGQEHPLLIQGEEIFTEEKIISYNPAKKDEVIGVVAKANKELAEKAIKSAEETFHTWKKVDSKERASLLVKAAAIVRKRKHEFSSLLVKEAGKPWNEADADTAEAIDFMEYYARQMIEIAKGKSVCSRSGEANEHTYIPRGVTVTIPPWNFALAIMVGTTVAPIVAGNTVILKPASNTPVIAAYFVDVLKEAGLPPGVLQFLPGSGEEIGNYLVKHPKVSLITFTGSKEVGTYIYEQAASVRPQQTHLKTVLAEMGGKDTIIVDKESDLDIAVDAILTSAFGFSGQKCSAGSRVVAHEKIYDQVLEKSVQKAKELKVGNPALHDTNVGPVIDQSAYDKIMHYIHLGKTEARLVTGGKGTDATGYFIQPTIFADAPPTSTIMQEEIFGPVVAFTKASHFQHALDIANNTEYGLTGAIISNNRSHIQQAKEDFHVGNLYINRNCTGAIVGYQPFGGFNMSGTNAKAGGPDYLLLYMQAKTISEKF